MQWKDAVINKQEHLVLVGVFFVAMVLFCIHEIKLQYKSCIINIKKKKKLWGNFIAWLFFCFLFSPNLLREEEEKKNNWCFNRF